MRDLGAKGITKKLAGVSALLALATGMAAPLEARAQDCPAFVLYSWLLDLASHEASQAGPARLETRICEFPVAGDENASLEIRSGGRTVYSRKIHVNLTLHFDTRDAQHPSELRGGHTPLGQSVVTVYLPKDRSTAGNVVAFRRLDTGALLAEGRL